MARTRWPPDPCTPASCTGQADQTGTRRQMPGLGPGRQAAAKTARAAPAESGVRPGPRPRHDAQATAKPQKQGARQSFSDHPCRSGRRSNRWPRPRRSTGTDIMRTRSVRECRSPRMEPAGQAGRKRVSRRPAAGTADIARGQALSRRIESRSCDGWRVCGVRGGRRRHEAAVRGVTGWVVSARSSSGWQARRWPMPRASPIAAVAASSSPRRLR